MYLYKIINLISGSIYIGITQSKLNSRYSSHKNSCKRGCKTPLYDAMRKYGVENFKIEIISEYSSRKELEIAEKETIFKYRHDPTIKTIYNILDGGSSYFPIKNKELWKNKLKLKRKGRKPALGMKHTNANKKLFGEYGKIRWDMYGRYDINEVLKCGFIEANRKFGISKTHYYRLRKTVKD